MAKDDDRVCRRTSVVERGPLEQPLPDDASTTASTTAPPFAPKLSHSLAKLSNGNNKSSQDAQSARSSFCLDREAEFMLPLPPPPTPGDDILLTRSSRSTSSASRNTNRLSITLPIAPPTCDPTRPVANSAVSTMPPSFPGTPAESSGLTSPSDANGFIIAIAAQERRVMELREELERAEGELKSLKRQFTLHEAGKKAADRRHAEPMRPLAPKAETRASTPYDDDPLVRRSVDLDRRKQILQGQQNTPKDGHRRVFTGKHTRTLSLLSPTKTDPGDFSVLEDRDMCKSPDLEHRNVPPLHAALSKRSTWQPRSYHPAGPAAGPAGMTQIVEDFKLGFKTFYEDIRQITVGDEPVHGTRSTAVDLNARGGRSFADDQETIRPANAARPRLSAAFDSPFATETPTKSRPSNTQRDRINARKKHFSWTPLSFDGIDGDAWLNFDSPSSSGKSTRWSGSTMNDEESDSVQGTRGNETPLKKKGSPLGLPSTAGLTPQKLEELTTQVVNRLSPSNLKRTANDFMKEWEKSMADPVVAEVKPTAVAPETEDKENVTV